MAKTLPLLLLHVRLLPKALPLLLLHNRLLPGALPLQRLHGWVLPGALPLLLLHGRLLLRTLPLQRLPSRACPIGLLRLLLLLQRSVSYKCRAWCCSRQLQSGRQAGRACWLQQACLRQRSSSHQSRSRCQHSRWWHHHFRRSILCSWLCLGCESCCGRRVHGPWGRRRLQLVNECQLLFQLDCVLQVSHQPAARSRQRRSNGIPYTAALS